MNSRRRFVASTWRYAVAGAFMGTLNSVTHAADPVRVAIAVPGPGNLLFLPITLAQKIGADKAQGITLDIRYMSGGPVAFKDMLDHNTDFAAGGLAALALQRLNGKPVVCVVPTTRVPAYTLLVRSDLKTKVKNIDDLAGKVLGVKGHVPGGRSTSQLFTEYILARAGLKPDRVNYVSVGQAYESQHAALASGTVDAIMGDEPFASRLAREKVAFVLADYHNLDTTRKQLGGLFLNGHVATREDFIASRPEVVERLVSSLQHTLVWIAQHSAQNTVDALDIKDPDERAAILSALKVNKHIYSPDGLISAEQVASVGRFLHATEPSAEAQKFDMNSLINAKWAGSAP